MTTPSSKKPGQSATEAGSGPLSGAIRSSAGNPTRSSCSGRSLESMPELSHKKTLALGLLLIGVGLILGLVVASDLGWLPIGQAVPEAPSAPRPVAMPLPADGAAPNFVEVAKVVTPAVVNIATTRINRLPEGHSFGPFDDPFFRRFFGEEFFRRRFEAAPDHRERSLGSGVIADPRGAIITNNHVVSKADEIGGLLSDKRGRKA